MVELVRRRVTEPVPVTLTVEVNEPGLFIFAVAAPVEETTFQVGVPLLLAVPANVYDVGPEGAV